MTGEVFYRGVYNPIPGLSPIAWYRIGKGITTATGVSQWNDQSGNARHLTQSTGAAQPALQSDGSILFDGAADYMATTTFAINQPYTWYVLAKQITWPAAGSYIMSDTIPQGYIRTTGSSPNIEAGANAALGPAPLALGNYGVLALVANGASSVFSVDGNDISGNAGALVASGIVIGCAGNGIAGTFHNVQIKEVIAFSSAHDAATRKTVREYLESL